MRGAERGFTLLEVLAAITIMCTMGLALLQVVARGTEAVQASRRTEVEMARVETLLTKHTLMRARDLDLRLGARRHDSLVVTVFRPAPGLYRVAVAHVRAPGSELLVTVVHRPEGGAGVP